MEFSKTNRVLFSAFIIGAVFLLSACQTQVECGSAPSFAYFGDDQNIFFYNTCTKESTQLTKDNLPLASDGFYDLGHYVFFNEFGSWSANGKHLVFGFSYGTTGFLLDVENRRITTLGAVKYAVWSPSGKYLAISRLRPHYYPEINDEILIVDPNQPAYVKRLEGYAPIWQDDTQLFYLSAISQDDRYVLLQQAYIHDLNMNESNSLPIEIRLDGGLAHIYAESGQFSSDKEFVTIYSFGRHGSTTISTFNFQTYHILTSSVSTIKEPVQVDAWPIFGMDTLSYMYAWSPTQAVLAICSQEYLLNNSG